MYLPGEKREYRLKCKIQVINQNYKEISDGKQHETKAVLLLPDLEASETSRMLMTYLPEVSTICIDCGNDDLRIYHTECSKCKSTKVKTEFSEVPSWIGSPVDGPCRLAVLRKNNYCVQHHFFVMSTGVEEELINMDGRTVQLTVLPIKEDYVADSAKSINRSAKQIEF